MSALDGWIDICRAGTWRDMQGRAVSLDRERLDRIVAAHAAADPAPIVVGHPEADAPAYAWVATLRRVGDRLQATLRDIAPAFREAVETGRYSGRSIALQGDTLRHVGFLGGRAPAVPGLAPTRFASEPEAVIAFADEARDTTDDEGAGASDEPRVPHPDPLRTHGPTGDEDGTSLVPLSAPAGRGGDEKDPHGAAAHAMRDVGRAGSQRDPERATARRACGAKPSERSERPASEGNEKVGTSARRLRGMNEREAVLDEREAALAAREAVAVEDERRRRAEDLLAPHVEAGRVLPAERAGLAALLAALDAEEDATVVFAAADGGEERQKPAATLERFLEGLPRRVDYRTLAGGPVPGAQTTPGSLADLGEDSERIAAEARALMAAERGVALTPAEAVDRARAKRGLATGGEG